jgi:hypothetical protein
MAIQMQMSYPSSRDTKFNFEEEWGFFQNILKHAALESLGLKRKLSNIMG